MPHPTQPVRPYVEFPEDRQLDCYDGKRYTKATGISGNLSNSEQDGGPIVQLWNINSRGDVGRQYLSLPVESIPDLVAHLQGLQREYEEKVQKHALATGTR